MEKAEAAKAIIRKDKKVLLVRRASYAKRWPGLWDFTGGRLEPGETPEVAVAREVKEETHLDISAGPEVISVNYKDKAHNLIFHYFNPGHFSGEMQLSREHSEYGWFDEDEIENLDTHPAVKEFYKASKKSIK
ncbi:NUDIX domain-containing protein [Patescibacteria group bacterium]